MKNVWDKIFRKRISVAIAVCFILLIAIILPIELSYYQSSYDRWFTDNKRYATARQYFIYGDLVFINKKILLKFASPNNIIFYPLNKVHEYFYDKGVESLPDKDAETAIWRYKTKIYQYARRNKMPDSENFGSDNISKYNVQYLNDIYKTMEEIMALSYFDENMKPIAFSIFPSLSFEYINNIILFYTSSPRSSKKFLFMKDKWQTSRLVNMANWLIYLKDNFYWVENNKEVDDSERYRIKFMLYHSIVKTIEAIVLSYADQKLLKCDSKYNDMYIKYYKEYYNLLVLYGPKISKNEIRVLTALTFSTNYQKVIHYILHKYCGSDMHITYGNKEWFDSSAALIDKYEHIFVDSFENE